MSDAGTLIIAVGLVLVGFYVQDFIRKWIDIQSYEPRLAKQLVTHEYVNGEVLKLDTPYEIEYYINPQVKE